jgi:hypothetical protein
MIKLSYHTSYIYDLFFYYNFYTAAALLLLSMIKVILPFILIRLDK